MEKLFFKNFDLIKLINLIEGHINKKLTTDNDIEEFKENYLFLSVYEIVHSFYLNYIDINNCITISSTRTLVRKSYELSEYLNMNYQYKHIYKNFCKDVHSTDSIINDTIRFFGKNIAIRNGEIEELLNEEPLTSEIEISSFTNYIVSEFLKCSSLFLNDKKLWEDYSAEFEKYYNQKWYS